MAKESGLGDRFYVGVFDLSGDINAIDKISGGPSPLVFTDITDFGMERQGGLISAEMTFKAYHNTSVGAAHPTLSALPTADTIVTYGHGNTIGAPAASCVAKQINYDPKRGSDGSLLFDVSCQSNADGIEWGQLGTAGKRTDGSATNGAGLDWGASSAFGMQAYYHLFAFTGTSVTVRAQDSNDDASTDPYANVGSSIILSVSAPTSGRIAFAAGTVKRWTRIATSGTFSNAVLLVSLVRNQVASIL